MPSNDANLIFLYLVESEATCCIAGLCCDHTFTIKDPEGNVIGKIVKQKPSSFEEVAIELASDSDVFAIEFQKNLDSNKKATLFGALCSLKMRVRERSIW